MTAYENPGQSFNRYKYASNNPYKFVDPDGRCDAPTGTRICHPGGTSVRSPLDTGQKAPIYGNAQRSSNTPTHASTSQRIANTASGKAGTSEVYLNKSLRTVTGDSGAPNIRPDVTVVNEDGTIDMHEVRSSGQTTRELTAKLADARAALGVAGRNLVVDPDPVSSVGFRGAAGGLGALGFIQTFFHVWQLQQSGADPLDRTSYPDARMVCPPDGVC